MTTEQKQSEQQLILSIPKEIMDFHIIPNIESDLKQVNMIVKLSKYTDQTELNKLSLRMKKIVLPNLLEIGRVPTNIQFEKHNSKTHREMWEGFSTYNRSLRSKGGTVSYILHQIKYAALLCERIMNTPLNKSLPYPIRDGVDINFYDELIIHRDIERAYKLLLFITILLPNKKDLTYKDLGYYFSNY